MAKKLWVGLGIGCGALVLIAVVAIAGMTYWVKSHVGGLTESAKKSQVQRADLAALEKDYPFQSTGEVTLTEARLTDYLAVRQNALTEFEKLQAELDAFKTKDEQKKMGVGEAVNAVQEVMISGVAVEQAFIDGLKQHKMSPSEFQAISRVALSTEPPAGPNAALLTAHKAQLEQVRNPGLDGLLLSGDPGATIKRELAR